MLVARDGVQQSWEELVLAASCAKRAGRGQKALPRQENSRARTMRTALDACSPEPHKTQRRPTGIARPILRSMELTQTHRAVSPSPADFKVR